MKKNNQTTFSSSSKNLLLILVVVCILFMGLSLITDGVHGPLRTVANYTIVPMQKGINVVGRSVSDKMEMLGNLKNLQNE